MQSAMPTVDELQTFLESQGLVAPNDTQLGYHLAAAIREFEELTGYIPFLADAGTVWRYDTPTLPQSPYLDLGKGYASITEIRINYSDSYAGDVQVEGTNYILHPLNHEEDQVPIEKIEWLTTPGVGRRSIKITGAVGYWDEVRDDVWSCIRGRAASLCMAEVVQGFSNPSLVKEGPVTLQFDSNAVSSKMTNWDKTFYETVARYERTVM